MSIVAVIFIGGASMTWPTLQRSSYLKKQNEELSARIAQKRAQVKTLWEYQRRFMTDADFVERVARQNNRVYPGELIFLFPKSH